MRIVTFEGKQILIQANTLTQFFHMQQFDIDFLEDAVEWIGTRNDRCGKRITWSLSKSYDFEVIDFDQWIIFFEGGFTDWESIEIELMKLFIKPQTSEVKTTSGTTTDYAVRLVVSANRAGISLDLLKLLLPHELMDATSDVTATQPTQGNIDSFLS